MVDVDRGEWAGPQPARPVATPGDCTDGQASGGHRLERGIARFTKPRTALPPDARGAGRGDTDWQGTMLSRVEADDFGLTIDD